MKIPSPSSAESVVAVSDLSRHFGAKAALETVSVYVPKGTVFGLVGENGAGKTTLIKHVLGLLKAESGSVRVFGSDPVADPVGVLARIGYLSEQPDLPGWMRVEELFRYTKAFYPNWDDAYAQQMLAQFGLNPAQRLNTLSKGQSAKAGLLVAQAHRPELLLLDEPSSGLDPLVRRDILEAVIRTVADRTRFGPHRDAAPGQGGDVRCPGRNQAASSRGHAAIRDCARAATGHRRHVEPRRQGSRVAGDVRWHAGGIAGDGGAGGREDCGGARALA
jgi:ABC-type Na+ transport system ATPase subunit NatA